MVGFLLGDNAGARWRVAVLVVLLKKKKKVRAVYTTYIHYTARRYITCI